MSRAIAVTTLLAALALPAPALARHTTCTSGHTKYRHAGTRLFAVDRRELVEGTTYRYQDFFACGPHQRRPTRIYRGAPATDAALGHIHATGRFVAFTVEITADPDSDTWIAGWFAPSTRRTASRVIGDTDHPDTGLFDVAALVVATDGSIAALDSPPGERQLLVALPFDAATGRLLRPRLIYQQEMGDVVPGTVAYAGGVVSWTSTAGEHHEVTVSS